MGDGGGHAAQPLWYVGGARPRLRRRDVPESGGYCNVGDLQESECASGGQRRQSVPVTPRVAPVPLCGLTWGVFRVRFNFLQCFLENGDPLCLRLCLPDRTQEGLNGILVPLVHRKKPFYVVSLLACIWKFTACAKNISWGGVGERGEVCLPRNQTGFSLSQNDLCFFAHTPFKGPKQTWCVLVSCKHFMSPRLTFVCLSVSVCSLQVVI